jgi:hypothetical protein
MSSIDQRRVAEWAWLMSSIDQRRVAELLDRRAIADEQRPAWVSDDDLRGNLYTGNMDLLHRWEGVRVLLGSSLLALFR